jgi:hypothetical protein
LEVGDNLRDLRKNLNILLKLTLKEIYCEDVNWIYVTGQSLVVGFLHLHLYYIAFYRSKISKMTVGCAIYKTLIWMSLYPDKMYSSTEEYECVIKYHFSAILNRASSIIRLLISNGRLMMILIPVNYALF